MSENWKEALCGIVNNGGPNGEPLACAYPEGHEGNHSWATLPTWGNEELELQANIKKIQALVNSTQSQYRHAGLMIWFVEQGLRPGTGGFLASAFGINGQVSGPGEYQPTVAEAVADLLPRVERWVEYYRD